VVVIQICRRVILDYLFIMVINVVSSDVIFNLLHYFYFIHS
jgi:hypothetical protein